MSDGVRGKAAGSRKSGNLRARGPQNCSFHIVRKSARLKGKTVGRKLENLKAVVLQNG